ncbi:MULTISPECIES: hypothetical protein [Ralstonia]|jgi:hypothetical protein|uniref:Transmembrane protein n=6 Tax=Pseudomonadati TaxID=3379134 RepID=R0CMY6_RALPI|nr:MULTISPECIES: hypothetical protein [Ralstonia]ENZ77830.1 hypothetical protein OR214_02106 [Ralstonia pickettii OR214]MBL4777791.1 hypothetical protein [Ralstonia sp.]MCM3582069.1 hypothetical protein [Ralstonia pickettii]MDR9384656.1 hypothetical protein [Ralstonia sp. 11b]OCS50585.1 hypothetical protein BEK68_13995 [Ralstonia pickettii]
MQNDSGTVDDGEERKRLYEKRREELFKLRLSNLENLDKSILTYSSAGLALSLGFLKDFIPIYQAKFAWALYGSWICFAFAISLVVLSYVVSVQIIVRQLEQAERYYLYRDEGAYFSGGWAHRLADHLNSWLSAAVFVVALILTILFVSLNLTGATMVSKKIVSAYAQDGAIGTAMQKVQSVQKGVTGMPMQTATPVKPASPAPAPQSQPSNATKSVG